jgi:zinc protease
MQLLAAYVAEPAFRPEAFERMRAYGMTMDSQFDATPNGVLKPRPGPSSARRRSTAGRLPTRGEIAGQQSRRGFEGLF